MKTMIKMLIVMMTLAVVILTFASCLVTTPPECSHSSTTIVMGKDATCTEAGLTDGEECSTCGEILVEQKEIPALGHTEEILNGEAPTCTSTGITDGKKCSVCFEVLVAQEEIPMAEHSEEAVEGKAATCTEKGLTEGKKCSACGATLVDQEVIPANGHKDEDKNFECDICFVDLCTDHIPAQAVEEKRIEATCTTKGSYELVVKCSQCGEEISREAKEIAVLPHSEEVVAGKEATCTSSGLTEGKKCSVCGTVILAQKEIPALKHTEEIVKGKEATCTETGLTDGKKCSVCGTVLVEQTEIPAGHTLENGICTVCGFIPNVFAGKVFVPSSDAAGNMYSSSFGYQTITDGIIFEEGKGRFSSKQNGGKVEATIDLGAVYDLNEFKVYLYWNTGVQRFGSGFKIEVLFGGEWTTVVNCESFEELQAYWVDNPDNVDKEWLIFDLGGVAARQLRFTIPSQTSIGWTTFYEMECSAKVSEKVEPEPEEPVFVENIFAGKQFIPTDAATASVLVASWWKGGGYETLTDGIKNADNAPGRFSTIMKTTGMMDATIDLGGSYELHSLKFYTYDKTSTGAGSVGADLLIQVYANGEWKDVVVCADNASVMSHLVAGDGAYDDYLEFDLGGIIAEKVRIYISASSSSSGTTYEEIECNGYAK